MKIRKYVRILPGSVTVDGTPLAVGAAGADLLAELYRSFVKDYPKFFKMDVLCKLGVVATELLVMGEADRFTPLEDRAVLLFSHSGPLCNDRNYQKTIAEDDFFPSPSLFVYTLANIVTGEIAIRNKYFGETSFIVMDEKDEKIMARELQNAFQDPMMKSILGGWLDCTDENHFEAKLSLIFKS